MSLVDLEWSHTWTPECQVADPCSKRKVSSPSGFKVSQAEKTLLLSVMSLPHKTHYHDNLCFINKELIFVCTNIIHHDVKYKKGGNIHIFHGTIAL